MTKIHIETDEEYLNRKDIIQFSNLEEIYEHVFGDDAINRYTHEELITMLDEMYDCYKYVVDNIYSKGQHIGGQ
tara:strand:+ start:908 stop:1129 length:222 start_codon:yes stop_codon:yes gene_type:complete